MAKHPVPDSANPEESPSPDSSPEPSTADPSAPEPEVRELAAPDHGAVVGLWRAAGLTTVRPEGRDSPEAFAEQISSGKQTVLGIADASSLLGVVVASHDGRKGWINRLAVKPSHRRAGLGRRLLRAAEDVLARKDVHVIGALIETDNDASLELFREAGYQIGHNVLYLSKRESSDS